jgi:hypothetical protein
MRDVVVVVVVVVVVGVVMQAKVRKPAIAGWFRGLGRALI